MSADLRTLLHEAAATPDAPVDPVAIHRASLRRRTTTIAGGLLGVVAVVGLAIGLWPEATPESPIIEEPPSPAVTETPTAADEPEPSDGGETTPPDEPAPELTAFPEPTDDVPILAPVPISERWGSGPSQSPTDAARDGVIPEVAALPLVERVGVTSIAATDEGVWVASRMPRPACALGEQWTCAEEDLVLGDVDEPWGTGHVSRTDYGELLLFDTSFTTILRAYPLPFTAPNGVNGERLVIADDAVYFSHQGDGGLPDSITVRIDRATLDPFARFRPSDIDGWSGGPDDLPYDWWVLDPTAAVGVVHAVEGSLAIAAYDHLDVLDPVTLEIRSTVDLPPGTSLVPGPDGSWVVSDRARIDRFGALLDPFASSTGVPPPPIDGRAAGVAEGSTGIALALHSPPAGNVLAVWSDDATTWSLHEIGDGWTPVLASTDDRLIALVPRSSFGDRATDVWALDSQNWVQVASIALDEPQPRAMVVPRPDGWHWIVLGDRLVELPPADS